MSLFKALGSGLAGALALTVLHETARRILPDAPRADILGMRAIEKALVQQGETPPPDDQLHRLALAGDIAANTLYYSLVGLGGKESWLAGPALGALAGIGAITLPGPLGLGEAPTERTPQTQAMTVLWYTAGGLVAALAYGLLND
jgi:hypothetical protein